MTRQESNDQTSTESMAIVTGEVCLDAINIVRDNRLAAQKREAALNQMVADGFGEYFFDQLNLPFAD